MSVTLRWLEPCNRCRYQYRSCELTRAEVTSMQERIQRLDDVLALTGIAAPEIELTVSCSAFAAKRRGPSKKL